MKGINLTGSLQDSLRGDDQPPVLIVGTGAMACLFAARLAASGLRIKMLGSWVDGLNALKRVGVRLSNTNDLEVNFPVEVTDDPQACLDTRLAFVLVKAYQTTRAARQLSICLAEDGLALTLQNGLDNYEILANEIGPERTALGVTTIGATLLEPGWVRNGGDGTITLGTQDRLAPMVEFLVSAGFNVQIVAETASIVWGKLVINSSINPLTALLRVPNGELLSRPSTRTLMGLIALETATIAEANGISLPYTDPVETVEGVAKRTATNYSSMLKDILRGSPTEIDAINGAIVKTAETVSVPAQINRTLWQLVKALEPEQEPLSTAFDAEQPAKEVVIAGNPKDFSRRQPVVVAD
jgi:2-dehydropantoate 2-reductase